LVLEVATVETDGRPTLSYAVQGDPSGPALVLLPGPTDSWVSYQPALERLPATIRAVAVSQRGHGDSAKPATGYRVEDFASDVVPLLDALGIERAVLAGHSGSCLVVRRVAIDAPARVAGLVLEASPTTLEGHPGFEEFVTSVVSRVVDPIDLEFARSFLVDTSSDAVRPGLLDRLVGELVKVPARTWREMFASLGHYDDTSELARIAAPSLLIWGDGDGVVSGEMQEQLQAAIPDAELVVYPGVGHTPRWEDPARFASDVAAFIRRTLPR
jgi:pimeloyl-ACP methyl ester carboxylesterase